MKKLKVCNITRHGKGYQVFFDSDRKVYFTNGKSARDYSRKITEFFNDSLHFLNDVYSDTFIHYRNLYFFIESSLAIGALKNSFELVDTKFEQVFYGQQSENYNTRVFLGLDVIYRELYTIIVSLSNVSIKRKDFPVKKKLEIQLSILEKFYSDYRQFKNTYLKVSDNKEVKVFKIA